ncbi:deoxyribodipyrimidine photo-lyase [Pontibacter sp. JH31]|uniref:Deoxyribodipyrimidine photo-lyase n=1 Tax=Pontibacter aquaedesilientis TaxID=2766980 RepID=A0ABR7XHC8_9BACT|nr:deoxyribodipyrimidine photo-lyase [Pontibacter aquaedesilientis]MBD1397670.1 deoxyribodipyrimidine photo-lyase [Pontibacter aquaedesilientis]
MLSIFWFRRDLRLDDNAGLYEALRSDHPVLPVFIFDKLILDKLDDKQDARVTFIHETVIELRKELEAKGGTLLVRYGEPLEVLRELIKAHEMAAVYTNHDYEPYARERDNQVQELLQTEGIAFHTYKDQVIFERDEIMTGSGTPYKVYTPYKNTWLKKFKEDMVKPYPSLRHLDKLANIKAEAIPTLEEMGFRKSNLQVPKPLLSKQVLENYAAKRDLPALDATSHVSPYLRFGLISVRSLVAKALQHSDTWLQELIWREFFMQLLYHFPESATESFAPKFRHISWRNDEVDFQKWCEGKTGFPLVDAGMRQLNATGFMHNRVRMVVASFLVKDLLIDWRWGEAYFAEKLLDYEQSSNVGNWQWAAGTGADAQPYFRVFNPSSQSEKFDRDKAYMRRWVPELDTPAYPEPMVDHAMARDRAVSAFKKAIAEMPQT